MVISTLRNAVTVNYMPGFEDKYGKKVQTTLLIFYIDYILKWS